MSSYVGFSISPWSRLGLSSPFLGLAAPLGKYREESATVKRSSIRIMTKGKDGVVNGNDKALLGIH